MTDAYTDLAGRLGYGGSERMKRVLRKIMDAEESGLVAGLPATVEEISGRLGKPVDETHRLLDGLFEKGLIFMTSKGYQFARSVLQLHDATGSNASLDATYGRELLDLWKEFCDAEWFQDRAKTAQEREKPAWRIVPALGVTAPGSRILPSEDLELILERATRFAVVPCPCRRIARSCSRPLDVCLQLSRGAEYAINRGSGRELTREEVMEVLRQAEEAGLIHTVPNSAEVTSVICNCCSDCCILYYPLMKYGGLEKGVARSRFQADVDQALCTGCQDCIERCQFDALEMVRVVGQKRLKARLDPDRCYGCGLCAVGCEARAIKLAEVRPPEWAAVS
ncbi:MAG: 4Fe-4S ferredoxin [Chloroflexi bacterium]|nr:4Fe-4S ferredoxin [Chloroflexota bacterium]